MAESSSDDVTDIDLTVNCAFGWVDHRLTSKTTSLQLLPAEFCRHVTTSSFPHFLFLIIKFQANLWVMSCFHIGCKCILNTHNYDFVHRVSAPVIVLDRFCSKLQLPIFLFFFSLVANSPIFLLHPPISFNFAGIDSENFTSYIHNTWTYKHY